MIKKTHKILKKLEFGILEILIGFLMVAGLLGYFWKVSADIDWIDHTVSFILFTFLFYQINITQLLFGKTSKKVNALICLSFFSLFFKDVISYTLKDGLNFEFLTIINHFYGLLAGNLVLVNIIAFYIGIAGIVLASLYLAKAIDITHPSLAYALYEKKIQNKIFKFIVIFVLLLAFYYFIYSLILEWLEFTLDDPIIVTGIIFYIRQIGKHHEKFHASNFIFKIGDFSTMIYSKFVSLFHYKKTLPLAISGLLMLHALSDLGVFAYSMIVFKENFYLELLKEEHRPFFSLFIENSELLAPLALPSLLLLYVLNIASLILFLGIPIFIWIRIFTHANIHFNRFFLFLIYASMAAYLLTPTYTINPLNDHSLAGVDILSHSMLESIVFFDRLYDASSSILIVSCIAIAVGLIAFWLGGNPKIKKELLAFTIIAGLAFFSLYLYYFFHSLVLYFYESIATLILTPHFIIAIILLIFLALAAIFYVGGYLFFLYETILEFHAKKWSEPIDDELVKIIRKIRKKPKVWEE